MALFYGSYVGYGSSATTAGAGFHGSGSNYGYAMGTAPGPYTNHIQKFSLVSAANATDVANITVARGFCTGHSSSEVDYGFCAGGGYPKVDVIDKHQFATTDDSVDVGDLAAALSDSTGASSVDTGFVAGGYTSGYVSAVQKFAFASIANATGHGDLSRACAYAHGMHSVDDGYSSGGYPGPVAQRERYSFASNTTAVDDGDELSGHGNGGGGISNSTHGFGLSGNPSGGMPTNIIDRFAFDSGGTAGDWGDLTQTGTTGCEVSATDYGWKGGGGGSGSTERNRIEKFAFASDAGSEDTNYEMLSINSGVQSFGYMGASQY